MDIKLGLNFVLILIFEQLVQLQAQSYADDPVIFCYYSSTAQFRRGLGRFIPEDIDTTLCTHVLFAFANVVNGRFLQAANREHLTGTDGGLYARTVALKRQNQRLKVLLALGGWAIGSQPFVAILSSDANRRAFVRNTVRFLRRHNFDGLDVDWEFPGVRGSPADDKYRFTTLLQELQEAFQAESRRSGREKLLLTLAAAGGTYFINKAYEPEKIVNYLDYLLVMAYNYHGSWNDFTGHHSGLKPRTDEVGGEREWNQAWTIDYWLGTGISPKRIVVGIPTYGMSFTLTNPSQHGLRSPASGAGKKGKYTQEQGILSYYEMCENMADGWHSVWIDEQKSPYAYQGDQWVGYENMDSVGYKARYIRDKGLGGAFIWSVEMDDFRGTCGSGKYPLLSNIAGVLRGEIDGPAASTNQIARTRVRGARRRRIKKQPLATRSRSYSRNPLAIASRSPPEMTNQIARQLYTDLPRDRPLLSAKYDYDEDDAYDVIQYGGGGGGGGGGGDKFDIDTKSEVGEYLPDYNDYEDTYLTTKIRSTSPPKIRSDLNSYKAEPDSKSLRDDYAYYDYVDDSVDTSRLRDLVRVNQSPTNKPAQVSSPAQNAIQERLLKQRLQKHGALRPHRKQSSAESNYNYELDKVRRFGEDDSTSLVQEYENTKFGPRRGLIDRNLDAKRGRDSSYDDELGPLQTVRSQGLHSQFEDTVHDAQLDQREMLQALNRRRENEQLEQQQLLQQQQLLLQQQQQQRQQLALQRRASSIERKPGSTQTEDLAQNQLYSQTEEICRREGLFPHPDSCSAYYICVQHGGRMYNFLMRCPASLTFDPETADCVYDVTCVGSDVDLVK